MRQYEGRGLVLSVLARASWVGLLVVTVVVLQYSANRDSVPGLGGLNDWFYSGPGWNYHALLMTVAFAICGTEALLVYHERQGCECASS